MFKETPNARQIKGEPPRRWFSDEDLDLIVWYNGKKIIGFQLCYQSERGQRALTWLGDERFFHNAIDDGESGTWHKRTPILVPDGAFEKENVLVDFSLAGQSLPEDIFELVTARLSEFGE